jgi:ubiquinone/menaquinone biosynthesis C-methylase UbiE
MDENNSEYILGTSDEELDRLGFQHQVWLDEAVDLWQKAGFGLGQNILDVGCGPGFATLDFARLVGAVGTVTAVDNSEKFIDYLERQIQSLQLSNVKTKIADVHSLGLADSSFDGAFSRWLLCFVADPESVVAEVSRCLKPGGRFAVMDYFNYRSVRAYPQRASIEKLFGAYYESVRQNGGSYDIAGQLPEIMSRNDFEVTLIKPINRIGHPGSRIWHWVESFHRSFIPKLVENNFLSEEDADQFKRDWAELSQNRAAFFFSPPMLGIIATKK